ncbi:MAG TPA: LCP family protein [Jatrophihabitans sp.]|jgi:LCP family protein required for cell wall assembly|uniref:LCP family protein n=1 Tax=Jatrophihabitans sp. TaxID=1932789 RepID=UPI002E03940A|nr:LCP family protein [Jatrophihabitans sp.]
MSVDPGGYRPATALPAGLPHGVRVGARAFAASLSLLIIVASGLAWVTFKNFTASVPHGDKVPALVSGETDPDGSATNILLIGNDTRAGATRAELNALHTGHDTTTVNADTMMVMHVPADGSRPTLVSFPRDSWVTIPGYGKGKINAAYPSAYNTARDAHKNEKEAESAGIIETIRTIHALTGLHIDHYMQVNLLGFYRISEAIGGVTVCLKAAQNATTDADAYGHGYSGINLPKGVSVIKGAQALAFVRQRHGLPQGDLDRIKRQQYFLKAAFSKVTSAGTLLNPFKMRDLLRAVGQSLLTDPDLDLLSLAQQLQSLTSGKIDFATIPNNGPKLIYPDGVETSIVEVDTAAVPAFVSHLSGKSDSALKQAKAAAPSTVTVDVLNGNGTAKVGSRNADALKRLGFRINTIDSTATTAATTVEYPSGKEAAAKAVLAAVPRAKAVETPSVSRVTLVIGTNSVMVTGVATPVTSRPAVPGSTPPKPAGGLGCID